MLFTFEIRFQFLLFLLFFLDLCVFNCLLLLNKFCLLLFSDALVVNAIVLAWCQAALQLAEVDAFFLVYWLLLEEAHLDHVGEVFAHRHHGFALVMRQFTIVL